MIGNHSPIAYGPKRETLLLSLLAIVVILIYADTLTTPFIFDDSVNIVENPHIRIPALSIENLAWAGFESPERRRPVANISLALNYYFSGYNLVSYHVVNILIHLACGIFLYLLTKATLQTPALISKYEKLGWIPFFTAFIWLVHPLQTQSVAYIIQRMNSMAAMFYILSMLFYVKFRMSGTNRLKWLKFAGCLISALLAFGTKEITATLPFFIILYEWFFFQKSSPQWAKRNFFALGGVLVLLIIIVFVYLGYDPVAKILNGYRIRDFTPLQRVLTQSRVVIFYISLVLWPNPSSLNLDHDFALSYSLFDPLTTIICIFVIFALIVFAILSARKTPLFSFSILWFFGNLVIESSVIGLELVFEHRNYLPSMFVILAIVALVFRYLKHALAAAVILSLVGPLFSAWTFQRNRVWADEISLYQDSAVKSPGKARPQNNLGAALSRQGKYEAAIVQYRLALKIKPDYADAHYNLGYALTKTGNMNEGLYHFRQAVRIEPKRVKYLNNLGVALSISGSHEEAIGYFQKALEINNADADLHNNLGVLLKKQGNGNAAMRHFSTAVALDPLHAGAIYNRGVMLMENGHFEAARQHFIRALEISPGYLDATRDLARVNDLITNRENRQKTN